MLRILIFLLPIMVAPTASSQSGPAFHASDGITLSREAGYPDCRPGSHCAYLTDQSINSADQSLTSRFNFNTGASINSDHFAFGVRGNPTDLQCTSGVIMGALGRGIIIFPNGTLQNPTPGAPQILFENFTQHCDSAGQPAGGVVWSTARPISFTPNTNYSIQLTANSQNVSYIIRRLVRVGRGRQQWVIVSSGDCRSMATGTDDQNRCAASPLDAENAGRAFILTTSPLPWSVENWFVLSSPSAGNSQKR